MKKLLAFTVATMMLLMSGCGNSGTTDSGAADGGADADKKIKVGFIYIGHVTDGGFTQAHDKGRLELEEKLGDKVETLYQEAVPENI